MADARHPWRKTLAAWLLAAAITAGLPPHLPWWRVVTVSLLACGAVLMLP